MNELHPIQFYFELPIYTRIDLNNPDTFRHFERLMDYNGNVDYYSPSLKENTTYSISAGRMESLDYFFTYGGINRCILTCVRTRATVDIFIYYDKKKKIVQKIGQIPSIADFHINQIKKYNKVLTKNQLKEFTRAIGLAANGVGIGSFVYLRRIFENLIEEAHLLAKQDAGWNDVEYSKQRMAEKIELLKNHLPEFLVENKSLYGILSVGIHSLKEQDCLAYFETVKVGIELILEEKLDAFKKKQKIEEAKNKIASLTSTVKGKK
ncbi:hypothetical protein [Tenacibaculum soleae]|uniref:hypothetical protein n=1 Tax=Tenacibaculum soleae TaxID=447689 RepID=UPI0026E27F04|nr:hypothetical protein [Tenacibaculum soleae]MDO6814014.1 hypothetical protein [Tenacibaculum soleae]